MGARKVAMVTPYLPELTKMVADYIEGAGIEVQDVIGLEVADNLAVGRLDPARLPSIAARLNHTGIDALVLSACVQMPSLAAVQEVEDALGIPVITAATATTYEILRALGHEPAIPGAGAASFRPDGAHRRSLVGNKQIQRGHYTPRVRTME